MVEQYENENNIHYDILIRLRPDIVFTDNLNMEIIPISDNICTTPNIAQYFPSNGMNDQFAIGSGKAIKTYLSLYDGIVNYVNGRVINPMRPETLLRYHMTKNNIKLNLIKYKYYVLRGDGSFLVPEGVGQKNVNDQRLIKDLLWYI